MYDSRERSMSVDWHQRYRFKSPRGQEFFSMMFMANSAIAKYNNIIKKYLQARKHGNIWV